MEPKMTADVRIEQIERSLHIIMNRPERKNAITMAMYATMADAIEAAEKNEDVRNIVLRGEGGVFTAGNDLVDFKNKPPRGENSPVARFMQGLFNFSKPAIACVQGDAVGIGTTMLLHCDLVYVGESAKLQMPFSSLGLSPEFASSYILPRIMGHVQAAELLLLGEPFNGAKAKELGLANQVIADAELLELVLKQAAKLSAQPPAALRNTKKLMRAPRKEACVEVMADETVVFGEGLAGKEFTEAVTSFFEKRKPDFSSFN